MRSLQGVSLLLLCVLCARGQKTPAITFPLIGLAGGQTLQLHLLSTPPNPPCPNAFMATLGFQDMFGNAVGPTQTVTLSQGGSATLSLNANSLIKNFGQRVEVLPTVVPVGETTCPSIASAEVIDNLTRITSVFVTQHIPSPTYPGYGLMGATPLEVMRLKVVAPFPGTTPCQAQLSFTDSQGNQLGKPLYVDLAPGTGTFLDFSPPEQLGLTQRALIHPILTQPYKTQTSWIASVESYSKLTGATIESYPPNPCFPSSSVCYIFIAFAPVEIGLREEKLSIVPWS
jgi:hypothetical protein